MPYAFNDDKSKSEVYSKSETYSKSEVYSKSELSDVVRDSDFAQTRIHNGITATTTDSNLTLDSSDVITVAPNLIFVSINLTAAKALSANTNYGFHITLPNSMKVCRKVPITSSMYTTRFFLGSYENTRAYISGHKSSSNDYDDLMIRPNAAIAANTSILVTGFVLLDA